MPPETVSRPRPSPSELGPAPWVDPAAYGACIGVVALEAVVVLLWWPKRSLAWSLAHQSSPDALLALVLALGAALAWLAIRAGAGELGEQGGACPRGAPGDAGSPTRAPRAMMRATGARLGEEALGQGVLAGWLLVLSAPLLVAAGSVSGVAPAALAWSIACVCVASLPYRMLGLLLARLVGSPGQDLWIGVRVGLGGFYLATAFLGPASQPGILLRLLADPPPSGWTPPEPGPAEFLLWQLVLTLGCGGAAALAGRKRSGTSRRAG